MSPVRQDLEHEPDPTSGVRGAPLRVRRYRLLVFAPALGLAVILIPLAVLVDLRFAFLLFILELAFALMVVPPLAVARRCGC